MKKTLKIVIVIIVIGVLGFFIFSLTQKNTPESQTGLTSTGTVLGGAFANQNTTSLAGIDDFASALASIKSIAIDTSVFTMPTYKALQDNPITLGSEAVGRANPFAPVGTDAEVGVFPTPAATEVISTNGASISTSTPTAIKKTSAVFEAQAAFDIGPTASIVFAYGTSEALGMTSAPVKIKTPGPVKATIKNLTSGTQYFVQATMTLGESTVSGDIISFTTL